MLLNRSAGILLHPSSLPSNEGIGTLGKTAYQFIDWLHTAHIRLWQVLPLGPTGYGDSPYAAFSSFAGNPLLIDLETLVDRQLLTAADIALPDYLSTEGNVDFGSVVYWKLPVLKKAAAHFLQAIEKPAEKTLEDRAAAYRLFTAHNKHLDEYALFMSIKEVYDVKAMEEGLSGKLWNNYWPKDLARCEPAAVAAWTKEHEHEIELHKVIQFFFFEQWKTLKAYANGKGISIIGDIPIFVAPDSSDVWANQSLFQLNEDGVPLVVAGVPPDYFSATGQLWGNPLYNWDKMKADGYSWWIDRIGACLELVDYIRIDHFRGFESYWAVPFGAKTAEKGEWLPGPDHHFFEAVQRALLKKDTEYAKGLPIIAEDLGIITPPVERLRDDFHLPGMKILQFAFSAADVRENGFTNAFLPHTYSQSSVVYTGTHDNTTLRAWFDTLTREDFEVLLFYIYGEKPEQELLEELFSSDDREEADNIKDELCGELIKAAFFSVSVFAVIPFQDLYALGEEARINEPSTLGKNWTWRMAKGLFTQECAEWLGNLVIASGRAAAQKRQ
ncbi:MAG: 4-alpha-glucanotransferase [Treponema sp.]